MIHPFLRELSLIDKARIVTRAGAVKLIDSILGVLKGASPAAFVFVTPADQKCRGNRVEGTEVFLCSTTVDELLLAGARFPNRKDVPAILGKVGEVASSLQATRRSISFDAMDILPYALVGIALWAWQRSDPALNGYPAEQARGAFYADDCDESQRRMDMAWKALQEMEKRGDVQFMHELKKVQKLAKQIREKGCEVI